MKSIRTTLAAVLAASALAFALSASAREIVIGQSLGLTGGGAEVAKQYLQGARCHFETLNKTGGVRGNTIRLVSIDDGGQKEKTLENAKKLIEVQKVFALFGFTAAAGAQAVFPLLEQTGVPIIGIASGGLGVHDKFRKTVFHVRASYYHELEGAIDLLRSSGMTGPGSTYAFVYNEDAKANLTAFENVARMKDARIGPTVGIDRNSTDMRAPVATILQAKPTAIIAITTAKAMAAVIKEARKAGFRGAIVSSSFAGDPLVKEAGPAGVGTVVIHVVPDPLRKTTGVVTAYHTALSKCDAMDPPSATGLEGYISARVFAEGLRRAGAKPTRETLTSGIESIRKFDLGGLEINYSPTDHEGSRYVDFLIISKSGKLKK
jgi:branched-chain amino acid transport system substrate-binding protein